MGNDRLETVQLKLHRRWRIRPPGLWATILLLTSAPHIAAAQSTAPKPVLTPLAALQACDRYAAYKPYYRPEIDHADPLVPGVDIDDIDIERALPVCAKAVELNPDNARAFYEYGRAAWKAGRDKTAVGLFQRASNLGSVLARRNLGALYLGNEGSTYKSLEPVPRDPALALAWYERAADADDVEGLQQSSILLASGVPGVPKDLEKGATYLRRLIKLGDPDAAQKLGFAISSGLVKPTRPEEMADAFDMATNAGYFWSAIRAADVLQHDHSLDLQNNHLLGLQAYYAYEAFRIAAAAPADSEFGSTTYQLMAVQLLKNAMAAGAGVEFKMPMADYNVLLADFNPKRLLDTLPLNVQCRNGEEKLVVTSWDWTRDYPPTDPQLDWYEKYRGCQIPAQMRDFQHRAFAESHQSGKSYIDTLLRLDAEARAAQAAKGTPQGLSFGQIVTGAAIATVAVGAAAICASNDKCSGLASHLAQEWLLEKAGSWLLQK